MKWSGKKCWAVTHIGFFRVKGTFFFFGFVLNATGNENQCTTTMLLIKKPQNKYHLHWPWDSADGMPAQISETGCYTVILSWLPGTQITEENSSLGKRNTWRLRTKAMCVRTAVTAKTPAVTLNNTGQTKDTQGTTGFQLPGWHQTPWLRAHHPSLHISALTHPQQYCL